MEKANVLQVKFQSTPLMRGETPSALCVIISLEKSQSTPLMRGETLLLVFNLHLLQISIHSPHARGDSRKGL